MLGQSTQIFRQALLVFKQSGLSCFCKGLSISCGGFNGYNQCCTKIVLVDEISTKSCVSIDQKPRRISRIRGQNALGRTVCLQNAAVRYTVERERDADLFAYRLAFCSSPYHRPYATRTPSTMAVVPRTASRASARFAIDFAPLFM